METQKEVVLAHIYGHDEQHIVKQHDVFEHEEGSHLVIPTNLKNGGGPQLTDHVS